MLLRDHMASSGAKLFRWRSFVLLAFVPAIIWATMQGEQVEMMIGHQWGEGFEVFAVLIVVVGEAIRVLTVGFVPKGTSGRNMTEQVATRLNTTGAYALVRNPLYLGNCLMYVGVVLYAQNLALALIFALALLPYYERIIAAEEAFLSEKFGAPYAAWASKVPAFIPRLTGWQAPDMQFSWRTVVKREHASIFGALLALYLIANAQHWANQDPLPIWVHLAMGFAAVVEVAVALIKKRTMYLQVEGR
jgi:protein-S-isoprenylcysteine O-methyltransferase Ste14